jgi:hypothetical protein
MAASLEFRLTTNGLGGAATSTVLSLTALNNLFDNVSPDEASAGDVEYRALDLYNTGDAAAEAVTVYCTATTSEDTVLRFALEASPVGSTTAIANESTAPTVSGSFADYTSAVPLSLPNIPSGSYARFWLQRSVSTGAGNLALDGTTLSVDYA